MSAKATNVVAHDPAYRPTQGEPERCSSKVQQPHRTKPTASDRHKPIDLRQRPTATFLPLVHTETLATKRPDLMAVAPAGLLAPPWSLVPVRYRGVRAPSPAIGRGRYRGTVHFSVVIPVLAHDRPFVAGALR